MHYVIPLLWQRRSPRGLSPGPALARDVDSAFLFPNSLVHRLLGAQELLKKITRQFIVSSSNFLSTVHVSLCVLIIVSSVYCCPKNNNHLVNWCCCLYYYNNCLLLRVNHFYPI